MTTELNSRTKRSQAEIVADVLEKTTVPMLKNHVIYQCNLNDEMFKKYVLPLVENGNLEVKKESEDAPEWYKRTDAGRILLDQLKDILKQLGKNEGAAQ